MNKFQPLKFSNVEDFLAYLPEDQLFIVERLREIVFSCLPPNGQEKLSYNVPYYYVNKRICFIWPAAVPWGKVERSGVMLGFCRGNELRDELGYLEKGERKIVTIKTFFSREEIEEDILRAFLFEAIALDEKSG